MTRKQLSQLQRECKKLRITHDMIAVEARSPRRPRGVHRTAVSKAMSGKLVSSIIIGAALRLIEQRTQTATSAA